MNSSDLQEDSLGAKLFAFFHSSHQGALKWYNHNDISVVNVIFGTKHLSGEPGSLVPGGGWLPNQEEKLNGSEFSHQWFPPGIKEIVSRYLRIRHSVSLVLLVPFPEILSQLYHAPHQPLCPSPEFGVGLRQVSNGPFPSSPTPPWNPHHFSFWYQRWSLAILINLPVATVSQVKSFPSPARVLRQYQQQLCIFLQPFHCLKKREHCSEGTLYPKAKVCIISISLKRGIFLS